MFSRALASHVAALERLESGRLKKQVHVKCQVVLTRLNTSSYYTQLEHFLLADDFETLALRMVGKTSKPFSHSAA